jgi:hypothetical protein
MRKCDICGVTNEETRVHNFNGINYCGKHYLQIKRHGKILERTIFDSNKFIEKEKYIKIVLFDKKGQITGKAKIDKEEKEKVSKIKWYLRKNKKNEYVYGKLKGKTYLLHRYILEVEDGSLIVDHINHNGLDNRKKNLRITNHKNNIRNMQKDKIIGVNFSNERSKWIASIFVDGKNIFLGRFSDKEDAITKRLIAEKKYFKEFAPQKHLFEDYLVK